MRSAMRKRFFAALMLMTLGSICCFAQSAAPIRIGMIEGMSISFTHTGRDLQNGKADEVMRFDA